MNINQTLYVTSRRSWRSWLSKHHRSKRGIWLVFYKKLSRKPSIDYDEAVEEALCYGWIDGRIKRMDVERYLLRFTPRRQESSWSESNKRRALRMLREGKMTQAGLKSLPTEVLKRGKKMTNT